MEDAVVIGGLMAVQFIYAGNSMNLMNDVHTEEHLAQEIEFHVATSACSDLLSQRNSDWHKLEVQRMGTKKRGTVLVSIFRPLEWNSFLRHSLCLHLREHYYFHLKLKTIIRRKADKQVFFRFLSGRKRV
ncbi:uncharacterized protein LOC111469135 isoform X5 [Cucurbita maxima]|uniref:Uncharacterized protein LOC111469135 isoform X5 n=1 Tax=Cucurbita maxima TaxID=3661 RepID=A0A6J1HZU8_CUCMA|nr:uncharacterized protein LOC111469135 isoform X5 [Cucurbita maxima]